jgi:hypothetical protein
MPDHDNCGWRGKIKMEYHWFSVSDAQQTKVSATIQGWTKLSPKTNCLLKRDVWVLTFGPVIMTF